MRRDWWLAAMCALLCGGCRAAELATPARPAISTRDLMRSVVEPNAFVVWNAVKTVGTFAGIEEWQPKSDAEWMAVRRAAMTVAEAGSQLMSLPRARERDEWIRAAQALVDSGRAAVQAAEVRNAQRLLTVGGEMFSACSSCHQKYMMAP